MNLVGNGVDTLHEEIEYLVGYYLVGNDVDTLHEQSIHLVGFSFIRVYDIIRPVSMEVSCTLNMLT